MDKYIVYKHITPNNKYYIGITKNIKTRFGGKGYLYKNCILFYNAIKKYGWDNITHEILFDNLTKEEAESREIELIEFYKSNNPNFGYNIQNGGNINSVNNITKIKISNSMKKYYAKNKSVGIDNGKRLGELHKGKKLSKEHKEKLKQNHKGMTGKKRSEQWKKWRSDFLRGKSFTNEHKLKLSLIKKGKVPTNAIMKRMKSIQQFDVNGVLIKEYKSIMDAERETKIANTSISSCCRNKRKTAGKYIWRFKNEI